MAASLAGCATDAQPTSGLGWQLVEIRRGNVGSGISVTPVGDDAYLVELTVLGAGGEDCGHPRFIGFEARGDVLVARLERPAITGTCLVTSNLIFDVLMERRFIPVGASRMELSEPCSGDQPGCPGHGVAILGPGGALSPGPADSATPGAS